MPWMVNVSTDLLRANFHKNRKQKGNNNWFRKSPIKQLSLLRASEAAMGQKGHPHSLKAPTIKGGEPVDLS